MTHLRADRRYGFGPWHTSILLMRQALLWLLGLCAAIAIGLFIAREQSQQLLANQARDSAALLAAQLGSALRERASPELYVQTLLQGVTHSGAYSNVTFSPAREFHADSAAPPSTVTSTQQTRASMAPVSVSIPDYFAGVPDWFASLMRIQPPIATLEVASGWEIAGQVAVSRHPGPALQLLWRLAVGLCGAGIALMAMVLWLSHKTLMQYRREVDALLTSAEREQEEFQALSRKLNLHMAGNIFSEEAAEDVAREKRPHKKHTEA
ncbi:LapD/MoxY N-terminal periplasmic domain-containing protein [Microbulbifer sp. ARAS458-1]|uniref:LapD/MoxY N-terminal periplasmic domain-containing protein n=1 Tax=Microbulbifer sp. ARAS458-1 TaxID=3140242 RepID=UPI003877949E